MSKYNWSEECHKIYELSIQGKTLQEIGDIYGVTREYIRQVINKYYPTLTKELRGQMLTCSLYRQKVLDERFKRTGRYEGHHASDLSRAMAAYFTRKKQNSKKSKWGWEVTYHDIEWNVICPIFGTELDWFAEKHHANSPSLDRVDPTKGYIPGNVRIISFRANCIKNNGTAEEHLLIADYMNEHLKKN